MPFSYSDEKRRQECQRKFDRETARLIAARAAQPSHPTMTDNTEIDPGAPTPTTVPIDEWMRREKARQVKREADRVAGEVERDGHTRTGALIDAGKNQYRY